MAHHFSQRKSQVLYNHLKGLSWFASHPLIHLWPHSLWLSSSLCSSHTILFSCPLNSKHTPASGVLYSLFPVTRMLAPQISTWFIFTCLSSLFLNATLLEFFSDVLFKAPHTPYHYLILSQWLVNAGKCLTTPGWGESLICNICSGTPPRSTSRYQLWSHWRQSWERLTMSSHHPVQTGSAHYCRWRREEIRQSPGAECPGGFGVDSGEPQRKGKLLGKEFCYRNRELSAFLLFRCFWTPEPASSVHSLTVIMLKGKPLSTLPNQHLILFLSLFRSGLDPLFFFALTCVPSSADPPGWQDHHVLR